MDIYDVSESIAKKIVLELDLNPDEKELIESIIVEKLFEHIAKY